MTGCSTRTALVLHWQRESAKEKQELKDRTGECRLPKGVKKANFSSDRHGQKEIEELRRGLASYQADAAGQMTAAKAAVKLFLPGHFGCWARC
jgi:hypothetical protein